MKTVLVLSTLFLAVAVAQGSAPLPYPPKSPDTIDAYLGSLPDSVNAAYRREKLRKDAEAFREEVLEEYLSDLEKFRNNIEQFSRNNELLFADGTITKDEYDSNRDKYYQLLNDTYAGGISDYRNHIRFYRVRIRRIEYIPVIRSNK